jgi:SAM-dependent methyltransferase
MKKTLDVYKSLICPILKKELSIQNEVINDDGILISADFYLDGGEKYHLRDGHVDFITPLSNKNDVIYKLENVSYVDKLLKNGWTFDRISKMDALRSSINNLLNYSISNFSSGVLLEVGAGGSYLKERYETEVDEWITSDYDNRARVDFRCDGQSLPFQDNLFDTILCIDVIEHVPDPYLMVSEMARVLKPGGNLILSTPFFFYLHESPNDFMRFSRFGLTNLIEKYNMEVLEVRPTAGIISTLGILVTSSIVHVFYRFKIICNVMLFFNKYFQLLLLPLDRFMNKSGKFSQGNFIISKKK